MKAIEHLHAAREHLCMAMAVAEDERQAAVARHPGGYTNKYADDAARLLEIAQDVHSRLYPQIDRLGL